MKRIGLLSDTHSFLDERVKKHLKNCDEIWHAGDIGSFSVTDTLKTFAKIRVVYGNIDDNTIRTEFKRNLYFKCEKVNVMMTHIGGYPGRYDKKILPLIEQANPDLFICGHSHILKVIYDKKHKLLHMNPGAIGNFGIHTVKTILCFSIDGKEIKDLRVVEFPRSKIRL